MCVENEWFISKTAEHDVTSSVHQANGRFCIPCACALDCTGGSYSAITPVGTQQNSASVSCIIYVFVFGGPPSSLIASTTVGFKVSLMTCLPGISKITLALS